MEDIIYSNSNQ